MIHMYSMKFQIRNVCARLTNLRTLKKFPHVHTIWMLILYAHAQLPEGASEARDSFRQSGPVLVGKGTLAAPHSTTTGQNLQGQLSGERMKMGKIISRSIGYLGMYLWSDSQVHDGTSVSGFRSQ